VQIRQNRDTNKLIYRFYMEKNCEFKKFIWFDGDFVNFIEYTPTVELNLDSIDE